MIYLTGDTHGDFTRFARIKQVFPEIGKGDYLIILGDFGFCWAGTKKESHILNEINKLPYTVLFVDGNHENFPKIEVHPRVPWGGGLVNMIRPKVLRLRRGHTFTIEDQTFFVLGGAGSVDRAYRTEGYSWWPEEQVSKEDMDMAAASLKINNTVDFVLTHTCPTDVFYRIPGMMFKSNDNTMDAMDIIQQSVKFKHWFFGHFHIDMSITDHYTVMWKSVLQLDKYMKGEDRLHVFPDTLPE